MSATLPPTAGLDRPSDFGAFWQQGDSPPQAHSVAPEVESSGHPLTPTQDARRKQLQVVVAGVISGLVAFTALAAIVDAVKRHNMAALVIPGAAVNPSAQTPAAALAGASQLAPTPLAATCPSGSAEAATLGTIPAPIAPLPSRQALAHGSQLGPTARTHASVAHPKPTRPRAVRPGSRKLP